jgi:hypothetical protein
MLCKINGCLNEINTTYGVCYNHKDYIAYFPVHNENPFQKIIPLFIPNEGYEDRK